jgi:N-acetylneuraminic acid mutarotase
MNRTRILSLALIAMLIGIWTLPEISLSAEGIWKTKNGVMPTPRYFLSTCTVDGIIYAIGGVNNINNNPGPEAFKAVEAYNPSTDVWTKKADLPTPRWALSASVVNGKIYVIGGAAGTAHQSLTTVEEYNPANNAWQKKAYMPTKRFSLSTCIVNGIIYAIGGTQDASWSSRSTVEAYDPTTDTWAKKADIPTSRVAFATSVVDGIIYAIGGYDPITDSCIPTVEAYNPTTNTWTNKADMPTKRGGLSTSVVGKMIYAFGGVIEAGNNDYPGVPNLEAYDPTTDKWIKMADMPTARGRLSTSVVNGKVYVIGGSKAWYTANDSAFAIVEEFTPETLTFVSAQGKLATMWGRTKTTY